MTYPTLRERVAEVLERAGFRAYGTTLPVYPSRGTFFLKPGAGVEVRVEWWDATAAERRVLLESFAAALEQAAFRVEDRGEVLYVAVPEQNSGDEG